ncbi:iron complex transport system permease protein [Nocardioides thalensis]|uniref:Iron complex transport system permease protein n=1 Tax=Nocardioides thalensis TaxID=1914755 RepID=A0A853CAZ8_9ACTN|nr:iron complex transport system permease protein [Nocardioides thalensis]
MSTSSTVLGAGRLGIGVLRLGPLSVRVHRRGLLVCLLLVAATLGAVLASLVLGDIQVGLPRVLLTVFGEGLPVEELIVQDYRLPRVATAALVGVALGMAGAVFQTISRNPLGSPDIVGFETGAATGGLVAMLVVDAGVVGTAAGAVVGGALTAVVVFSLAARGGSDGLRLVLIGVGVGSVLLSFNSMLIVSVNIYDAQGAGVWLVGNVAGATWDQVAVLAPAVVVLAALALLLSRALTMTELSDGTAVAAGLPAGRVRVVAGAVGVAMCSVAVAAAGPVAFIALTAPQVARRLTRASGPNLVASGLTGALFLVVADHAARELFQPRQVAVGVMTGVVGGLYLAWLLTREWRSGRA